MTEHHERPSPPPWYRGPAFFLLVSLVALYVAAPLIYEIGGRDSGVAERLVSSIILCGVLVLGVRAVTQKRGAVLLGACMGAVGLVLATCSAYEGLSGGRPQGVGLASVAVFTAFLAWTTISVLCVVLRDERVSADKIFAAICAYLLLGFTFAFAYTFLWGTLGDDLFRFPPSLDPENPMPRANDLIYFSFTTLTTLGYGDITPASPLSRSLATLEALVGQFYVGILVARLVSLQLTRANTDR